MLHRDIKKIPAAALYEGVSCTGPRIWWVNCADCGDELKNHPPGKWLTLGSLCSYGYRYILPDTETEEALRVMSGKAARGWVCPDCVLTYDRISGE